MPVQNIAGRKPEIKKLQGALHSDQPELLERNQTQGTFLDQDTVLKVSV